MLSNGNRNDWSLEWLRSWGMMISWGIISCQSFLVYFQLWSLCLPNSSKSLSVRQSRSTYCECHTQVFQFFQGNLVDFLTVRSGEFRKLWPVWVCQIHDSRAGMSVFSGVTVTEQCCIVCTPSQSDEFYCRLFWFVHTHWQPIWVFQSPQFGHLFVQIRSLFSHGFRLWRNFNVFKPESS